MNVHISNLASVPSILNEHCFISFQLVDCFHHLFFVGGECCHCVCVCLGLAELPCLSSNYRSPFHCRYIFFMQSKIILQPSLFHSIKSPLSPHSISHRSRFTLASFYFHPLQFLYDVLHYHNASFPPMSPCQAKQSNPIAGILVICYLDVMACNSLSLEIVSHSNLWQKDSRWIVKQSSQPTWRLVPLKRLHPFIK